MLEIYLAFCAFAGSFAGVCGGVLLAMMLDARADRSRRKRNYGR